MTPIPTAALALSLALAQPTPTPTPTPTATATATATSTATLTAISPPTATATGPVLTLEEALSRAAGSNLDLKAAEARLEQARAGVGKAWSLHLPQVKAGATWTHNSDESRLRLPVGFTVRQRNGGPDEPPADPADLPGDPVQGPLPGGGLLFATPSRSIEATLQKQDQLGAQVEVSQALVAPGLWYAIRASRQGAAAAERSVDAVRRDVLFGVAQVYYGTTSLKKLVEVSERLLEIARRQEKDAEVRYRAGTIAKVGYLRAEIDRARAEQDLLRSRNAFESARVALAALLDRDAGFDVAEPPDPPAPREAAALERAALAERADLQAARLTEEVAGSLRTATSMRYLPSLGAFGRWQIANVGGFTGKNDAWAVGLGLSWTLFDGGLREAELREAGAKVAEATAARRSAEVKALTEVRQALLDWESAKANAVKAREQRDLAAENQRLVDVSFRAGAATAVEQADATAQLRTAELAQATEALSAQLAALRVLRSAGEFAPTRRR